MNETVVVNILAGREPHTSRVIVNGMDLSSICTGFEMRAIVGEGWTQLTLHLVPHEMIVHGEIRDFVLEHQPIEVD